MVRTPGIARPTPAASAPTWVCAVSVSFWMRPPSPTTTAIATATTTSVRPSSSRLISAIAITDPTKTSDAGHRVDQPGRHHRAQQGGVRSDPGDQVAGAAGVELVDRQPQQPVHQQPAGVEHDALRGALQQVLLHAADHRGRQHQHDQQRDDAAQRLGLLHRADHQPDHRRLGDRQHAPRRSRWP